MDRENKKHFIYDIIFSTVISALIGMIISPLYLPIINALQPFLSLTIPIYVLVFILFIIVTYVLYKQDEHNYLLLLTITLTLLLISCVVNPPTSLIPIKPNSSQETLQPTQYNTQTQGNISNQQGSQASQEENITNLSPAKPVYDSETGHYYDQIDGSFTWDAAKIASEKSTLEVNGDLYKGHLATITTPAENDFIVGKFNISRYWLGGFQPANSQEPAGGWQWVTNESWSYTNWFIGDLEGDPEPNNFDERENLLVGWYHNQWNDFPNNAVGNDFFSTDGYIVEYEPEQIL